MTNKEIFDIVLTFRNGQSLYDKTHKILFMPDVANEPATWYGLQIFHMNDRPDLAEMIRRFGGITAYCLRCIPAPGVHQDKEDRFGWTEWYAFNHPYKEDTEECDILSELLYYAYHKFTYREASEIEIRED